MSKYVAQLQFEKKFLYEASIMSLSYCPLTCVAPGQRLTSDLIEWTDIVAINSCYIKKIACYC